MDLARGVAVVLACGLAACSGKVSVASQPDAAVTAADAQAVDATVSAPPDAEAVDATVSAPPDAEAVDVKTVALDGCTATINAECMVRRLLVSCTSPSLGVICLSDDAVNCQAPDGTPLSGYTCQSHCTDLEYGASCGVGPYTPDPGPRCRSPVITPGGALYCCPCGP